MTGAENFHAKLTGFLDARALPFSGLPPEPHITINYRGDGLGGEPIDPISWLVDEIVLVESIVGETRHETHGRWLLRARA